MKTLQTVSVELVEIPGGSFMPQEMEFGKVYYSKEYSITNHLCLCGCGHKVPLPLSETDWMLVKHNESSFSIMPSILQRFECKSHYIIIKGKANFV